MTDDNGTARPLWAVPGSAVALVTRGGSYRNPSFRLTAVERVTATQIIVDGRRFKPGPDGVEELGKSVYRGQFLLPADDPQLAVWTEAERIDRLRRSAATAAERWSFASRDIAAAEALVGALTEFIGASKNQTTEDAEDA
jgi:hypothetical protein